MRLFEWIFPSREADQVESFTVARRAVGLQAVPGILIILAAAYMINSTYLKSVDLNSSIQNTIAELSLDAESLDAESGLPEIFAVLDKARTLEGSQSGGLALPLLSTAVDQDALEANYQQITFELLRPHLLRRLETQMEQNINNFGYIYQTLMVYLMLGQAAPMERDTVALWVQRDWEETYAGNTNWENRDSWFTHLDVVLQNSRFSEYPLNGELVDDVRRRILSLPPAQRLYLTVVNEITSSMQSQWRVSDVAGPAAGRLFVRKSGLPLSTATDGMFTRETFEYRFLPSLLELSSKTLEQDKILGLREFTAQTTDPVRSLVLDTLALYERDYIQNWEDLLADIDIVSIEALDEALDVIQLASTPESPIKGLLTGIAAQTDLLYLRDVASPTPKQRTNDQALQSLSRLATQGRTKIAVRELGLTEGQMPGSTVTQHFAWLHDFVEINSDNRLPENDLAPLDSFTEAFNRVHQDATRLAASTDNRLADQLALEGAFARLNAISPPLLKAWVRKIENATLQTSRLSLRENITQKWKDYGLDFCRNVIIDRFPFASGSERDVALRDFSTFFGPGGITDTFFRRELFQYIDVSQGSWTWKGLAKDLEFSQNALDKFKNAIEIRDAFFPGSSIPRVNFRMSTNSIDVTILQAELDLGSAILTAFQGGRPNQPVTATWPSHTPEATLILQDLDGNTAAQRQASGDWATLRLLQTAAIRRRTDTGSVMVVFDLAGLVATFNLEFATAADPFFGGALKKFQCPTTF